MRSRKQSGQTTIEYLFMTLILTFFFISLFRMLQYSLTQYSFTRAGMTILTVYY